MPPELFAYQNGDSCDMRSVTAREYHDFIRRKFFRKNIHNIVKEFRRPLSLHQKDWFDELADQFNRIFMCKDNVLRSKGVAVLVPRWPRR